MNEWTHPSQTLGVHVPKPRKGASAGVLLTRRITNLPIRVPSTDWAAVVNNEKRMFRTYSARGRSREGWVVRPGTECPRPCLLFSVRYDPSRNRRWEAAPGVLLSHRQEPLGAITPEDLEAEGFASLLAFRFYWRQRHKKLRWRPWEQVSVLEVRPWQRGDHAGFADWAIRHLFGDWLSEWNEAHK